jgi:hypothetical protein
MTIKQIQKLLNDYAKSMKDVDITSSNGSSIDFRLLGNHPLTKELIKKLKQVPESKMRRFPIAQMLLGTMLK